MDNNISAALAAVPWGLAFGALVDAGGACAPAFLPTAAGGVVLNWQGPAAEGGAQALAEHAVVGLLEALPAGLLQVDVVDFALRRRFAAVSQLAECHAYRIHHDVDAARKALAGAVRVATWRHHHLLGGDLANLGDYIERFGGREPYHVLVINLPDIKRDATALDDLAKLLDGGLEAGFIVLLLRPAVLDGDGAARLDALCQRLPALHVKEGENGVEVSLDAKAPGCAPLAGLIEAFGLSWSLPPADAGERVQRWLAARKPDDEARDFISVPIGTTPDGRSTLHFSLGPRSGCNHAFILGMSGSGKTTLLNNLILGIGEQYSPQEVQLFLMDYKDGVEFQAFRDHPHCARIFLDNTDRDAATRLLEEFAATIAQRGALFREEGGAIKDLEAYNACYPDAPLPRLLLIIDEAQELFGNQWRATQHFNELLKQVVKKGRAFGVHVILSTQTLLTSNIDRELMTQINLRIAFKLNNSGDCDRILSFGNDAPLHLQRYEMVLNDDSGLKPRNRIGRCAPPRDIAAVVAETRRRLPAELRRQPEIVASARSSADTAPATLKTESLALDKLPNWLDAGTTGKTPENDEYAQQRALLASVELARLRAIEAEEDLK